MMFNSFNGQQSSPQRQHEQQDQQQDRKPSQHQQPYQPPNLSHALSADIRLNLPQPSRPQSDKRGLDARAMASSEHDFMQFNPFLAAGSTNAPLPSVSQSTPIRMSLPDAGPSAGPSSAPSYDFGGASLGDTPDANSQNKKKKRRPNDSLSAAAAAEEKRTKTGRACDACRSKKIRCDILQSEDENQPICAHCKQYNIECTFFLPITETRFKKRRQTETAPSPASKPAISSNGNEAKTPGRPASILSLVHSSLPTRSFEHFDMSNHAYWEVREDEHGRIKVEAQAENPDDSDGTQAQRLAKYVLPGQMMTALVNSYFDNDHAYLPIVNRADFIRQAKPYPLLLYAMCAATATRREFPRHVFQRMRGLVNGLIRANEILSHARLEHIQALLLCCTNGDLNAQPTAPTASAANLRLGVACRMGQDLGLHREQTTEKPHTAEQVEALELRRRLWAALMTYDAWYCAALALPMVLNVNDCDVPLPSPYRLTSGQPVFDERNACLGENLKLSMLLARVFRAMYGPTGSKRATDDELRAILTDLATWHEGLPLPLRFTGNESSILAGMLQMLFTTVQFLFWRGFLRVQHPPPSHLKLMLNAATWNQLVNWSRECIEWLNANDHVLDTLYVFPYTATSCALVQYHHWARKREMAALETLKLVRDIVARWEEALQPDQMSTRKKSCETMMLLYEAALKTLPDDEGRTERSEGTPGSSASRAGTDSSGTMPAFGKRSQAHAQSAQQSRYLERLEGDGPHVVKYDNEANSAAELVNLEDPAYDVSFLDNLPESNFDWLGWGQYFEKVDRIFAGNDNGEAGTSMPGGLEGDAAA